MTLDDALAIIHIYDTELVEHLDFETKYAVQNRIKLYTELEMRKREVQRKHNTTRTRNQRKKMDAYEARIKELEETNKQMQKTIDGIPPRDTLLMLNSMQAKIEKQNRYIMELEIKAGVVKIEA